MRYNRLLVKKGFLFIYTLVLTFLQLPFAYAKVSYSKQKKPVTTSEIIEADTSAANPNAIFFQLQQFNHNFFNVSLKGLSRQAFEYAMNGFAYLKNKGQLQKNNIISIIDFSKPSNQKRLFVIDVEENKLLFNTYVAHGINSGTTVAENFSNTPESKKSSLGFFETTQTYIGKNGYSLHLNGLEDGINNNANKRDIVFHGADYVSQSMVDAQGYIGRSQGCPALPIKICKPIIDKIKNGSCVFIYAPDKNYIVNSKILQHAKASLSNLN
jgi:L,D-transpeptidase catalytic domain